ncbi:MAG: hypothetical protein WCW13_02255 [archaeon]|jgi:hypothetical protein
MRYITIISILTLALLLFGCISSTQTFALNEPFQVKAGSTFYNQTQDLTLKVISFSDSRCTIGNQCFWAGELGVNLQVNDTNVFLGAVTKKSVSIAIRGNAVNLSIVSIDKNSAALNVTFTPANQVACTMEAKVCPDGSYVGRTAPLCEFTPCPGE